MASEYQLHKSYTTVELSQQDVFRKYSVDHFQHFHLIAAPLRGFPYTHSDMDCIKLLWYVMDVHILENRFTFEDTTNTINSSQ